MHISSMKRMEWFVDTYLQSNDKLDVLDIGSYDVNGCYKVFFNSEKFRYVGLDMEAGPNVDLVPSCPYQWTEIRDEEFDVVISGQALEHVEFFWITMAEIVRATKEGGLICIIAPNGFSEHRYPVDCWRFFTDGMIALARFYQLEIVHTHTNAAPSIDKIDWYSSDCADSILIARKPYSGGARKVNLREYTCIPADHQKLRGNMITFEEHSKKYKTSQENSQHYSETCNEYNQEKSSTQGKGTVRSAMKQLFKALARKFAYIRR